VEHSARGTCGLILNRPIDLTIGKIADVPIDFVENEVYLGGDVGSEQLYMVHPCGDLTSASEVIPGVFCGGDVSTAWQHIRYGQYLPKEFKFFIRTVGTRPHLLLASAVLTLSGH
jgi:putative AlgH/UPF0301 family transcriptional regulator